MREALLTKEIPPTFGWTPDCKWPVVYGERGRLRVRLSFPSDKVSGMYTFANEKTSPYKPSRGRIGHRL